MRSAVSVKGDDREARLTPQIDATWARYRRYIIGLTGLYGEILAAHLAVEAEMEGRLRLLMSNPDVILERSSYAQKLGLFIALWPGEASSLKSGTLDAVRALGALRNAIAHGRSESDIDRRLDAFLETYGSAYGSDKIESLRSLTMEICGYLCGLTDGVQKARLDPAWSHQHPDDPA